MPQDIQTLLKDLGLWISNARRVVLVGVGNPLRRDDFVGVEVVRKLQNNCSPNIYLLDCETVPESFIEPILEFSPTHVLIIDAALLHLPPGSVKLVDPKETSGIAISTHALPLKLFSEYVTELTGAKVGLLAIQPRDTSFGEGLSRELRKTVDDLVTLLLKVLPT